MTKDEFKIGEDFYTATGRWMCTDIGTRTIVAIKHDGKDPSWRIGPGYAVEEVVFDYFDMQGCSKSAIA